MTPDELERIGRALYGNHWQSPVARDLGVTYRTMRRWMTGQAMPDRIGEELRAKLQARQAEIARLTR